MENIPSLKKSIFCQYRANAYILQALPCSLALKLTLNFLLKSKVFLCCHPSLSEFQQLNILLGPRGERSVLRIQIQSTFLSAFRVT